mmetsp:Transcript_35116/g.54539  ORF Transcript_35116/g.54539 Transcript_35116/m.54539 type:complete len:216 (-) Transcript_35116:111-758(-)
MSQCAMNASSPPQLDVKGLEGDVISGIERALEVAMAEFSEVACSNLAGPDSDPTRLRSACDGLLTSLRSRTTQRASRFSEYLGRNLEVLETALAEDVPVVPAALIAPLHALEEAGSQRERQGDVAMEEVDTIGHSASIAEVSRELEASVRLGQQLENEARRLQAWRSALEAAPVQGLLPTPEGDSCAFAAKRCEFKERIARLRDSQPCFTQSQIS